MRFSPNYLAALPESSDRRARSRRNPPALSSIEIGDGNGGIILNISETGIAVAVAQSMANESIPSLSFRLPQLDRNFQAQGEIVWLSESKKTAGVRFVNLDERDRLQLRNWIRAEIVAAELQTPYASGNSAAPKPVLTMPSPRTAVRQTESDDARTAEFERMFPSESSLKARGVRTEPEFNSVPAITEDKDVKRFTEVLLVTQELNHGDDENSLKANYELARQFQLQHENLEQSSSLETVLEPPASFSAPLPDLPAAAPVASAQITPGIGEGLPSDIMTSRVEEAGEIVILPAEVAAGVLTGGRSQLIRRAQRLGGTRQHAAARPKTESSLLGLTALSAVFVAICFVLGYAIQPRAFRLSSAKSADIHEVATPNATVQSEARQTAAATRPINAVTAQYATSTENGTTDSAEGKGSPVSSSQTTPVTIQTPAPNAVGEASVADAAPVSNRAAVPVSFFPVTAPSGGSPAKLMELPEELISETPSIVVRSHQFLFVPPQAGLESEHSLERVHLGDRILKVNPTYPVQALEKSRGGTVHLRSTIGPDGAVLDVQAISGPTSLIPAAVSAVRQWRYMPTDIDGNPISIEEDILVEFRPSPDVATR